MAMTKNPCRICEFYRHEHTGGPRTYGTCKHPKQLPYTHANTRACKDFRRREFPCVAV